MSSAAPTIEDRVARLERLLDEVANTASRNVNRIDRAFPDLRREIAALERRVADLEREVRTLQGASKNKSGVRP